MSASAQPAFELTAAPAVALAAARQLARARAAGHRLILMLSGDRDWTAVAARAAAAAVDLEDAAVWLSDRAIVTGTAPLESATRLLGGECGVLIYDAWSGFDPDGFGAATGSLRGGGLLLLLTPPLDDWPILPDPQAGRIAPWPLTAAAVRGRFIARLVRVLRAQPGVVICSQGETADCPVGRSTVVGATNLVAVLDPAQPATPDQQRAIEAILRHARGRPHRPLVLTAHRGRGKSAALGLAAARLLASPPGTNGSGPRHILVTAPSRAAGDALFHHAARAWPGSHPEGSGLSAGDRSLTFIAPDACCQDHPAADLLLVDEAAGIPAPLLTALLMQYPRVVFATTVHGYEGTGRGFDLRFRETLDHRTPHWRGLTLESPIRWSVGDPLEALVFRALLLDAAPATAAELHGILPGAWRCERLDRDALAADDATLGQVFGLLVLAHYQTRPLDLRLLLDGPGVRVLVLRDPQRGLVAATLIAVEEGGMTDPDLLAAIYEGRRRPRGHLLPQTLSAHAGILDAPRLRYLRVIRIAVHPALARQGLGRRLLRLLFRQARAEGMDLLGSSFGATPGLIAFWSTCGFVPAQIGTSRNAASGEHALVVLRRTSRLGAAFAAAGRRLQARLAVLLPGPLRRLDPTVVAALIAAVKVPIAPDGELDREDAAELRSFSDGYRTVEAALPALVAVTRHGLRPALRSGLVSPAEAALLAAVAAQLRPVGELVALFQATGRAELIRTLRGISSRLCDLTHPACPRSPPPASLAPQRRPDGIAGSA